MYITAERGVVRKKKRRGIRCEREMAWRETVPGEKAVIGREYLDVDVKT